MSIYTRGEHGSDFSSSSASGSGFSGFGFEILIPNPSEVISGASGLDFGVFGSGRLGFGLGRMEFRVWHNFFKNTTFLKLFQKCLFFVKIPNFLKSGTCTTRTYDLKVICVQLYHLSQ